jgi:hypothetical protein
MIILSAASGWARQRPQLRFDNAALVKAISVQGVPEYSYDHYRLGDHRDQWLNDIG